MEDLYHLFKRYSAVTFLAIATDVLFGYDITTWQWWVFIPPTIFLYVWKYS